MSETGSSVEVRRINGLTGLLLSGETARALLELTAEKEGLNKKARGLAYRIYNLMARGWHPRGP